MLEKENNTILINEVITSLINTCHSSLEGLIENKDGIFLGSSENLIPVEVEFRLDEKTDL
jgi:hypothetical protein